VILAIDEVSLLEPQSPLKGVRLALVRSDHVATFIKSDILIIVVIQELYFELGGLNLDYFTSGPGRLSSEVTELKNI